MILPLPRAALHNNRSSIPISALVMAFLLFGLVACSSKLERSATNLSFSRTDCKRVTVYVSTVRAPADDSGTTFTSGYSPHLRFVKHVISIPPTHKANLVEWPSAPPDPAKEFVTLTSRSLTADEFYSAIVSANRIPSVRLFVHGYNNTYQESVYRLAQLTADSPDGQTPVLFAWPSQGNALSYSTDRRAALASTDGLAETIEILVQGGKIKVSLLAHSMGAWLAMGTLAGLSRTSRFQVARRLDNIVLAAPDIDTNDMIRKLNAIGRLAHPLNLLVSGDDKALAVSRIITGGHRVGADDVYDPWVKTAAMRYGARVIDISELSASDSFRHSRFTAMVSLYSKFHGQIDDQSAAKYAGPGTYVFHVATAQLEPTDQ